LLAGKAANEAKKLAEEEPARYDTFDGPDCTLKFSYHVINWLINFEAVPQ